MPNLDKRIAVLEKLADPSECNCRVIYKVVIDPAPDPEPTNCPVHGPVSNVIRMVFVAPTPP